LCIPRCVLCFVCLSSCMSAIHVQMSVWGCYSQSVTNRWTSLTFSLYIPHPVPLWGTLMGISTSRIRKLKMHYSLR
jgi:hypothetical protein